MLKKAILAVAMVLILGTAYAQSYAVGHVENGYSYLGNGLWQWPGGGKYTRRLMPAVTFIQNGCYVTQAAYYQYSFYTPPYVPPTPAVTAKDPDWRNKVLEYAIELDKQKSRQERQALEQQYFLESVKLLGLEGRGRSGPLAYPGGVNGPLITSGHYYSSIVPVSASTQYGLSSYSSSSVYGDGGIAQLLQTYGQLVAGAQKHSIAATESIGAMAADQMDRQAKLQEMNARMMIAVKMMDAISGPPTTITSGFKFTVESGGKISKSVDEKIVTPEVKRDILAKWQTHASNACQSCHFGATLKGGFDVDKYLSMTGTEKEKVLKRLASEDEKFRMPRNADGSAGPKLTREEFQLWMLVEPVK